jgi:hypothetical protein
MKRLSALKATIRASLSRPRISRYLNPVRSDKTIGKIQKTRSKAMPTKRIK